MKVGQARGVADSGDVKIPIVQRHTAAYPSVVVQSTISRERLRLAWTYERDKGECWVRTGSRIRTAAEAAGSATRREAAPPHPSASNISSVNASRLQSAATRRRAF